MRRLLPILMCAMLLVVSTPLLLNSDMEQKTTVHPNSPSTRMLPPEIDLATNWDHNFTAIGIDREDYFGDCIASGDLNGDGFDEIIIGASFGDGKDNTGVNSGEVHVIKGKARGVLGSSQNMKTNPADSFIYNGESSDAVGSSIAVGDIDNDNLDDIVIGVPGGDYIGGSRPNCGEVHIP